MAQLTIVTTPTNSGDGTPLATSFNYCNSNFSELYARVQTSPPATLVGITGDTAGMYAYDATYFYYCFANYDGTSIIWGQVTQVGNITVSTISNGTSNVKISDVNGNATTSVAGTPNVVVVASTGQYVSGVVSATGNVTGGFILGNGSQLTGLPQSYTNANVAAFLPLYTGNLSANNTTSNTIVTTGNITGGNIRTPNQISATGNIVTDQYFVGNFFGNVTGNFVIPGSNTQVVFNTNGNADAVAGFTFNKDSNTLIVLGVVSSSGNVIAGNVSTAGRVSATGNITGGNVSATTYTGTTVSVTGTVTAASTVGGVITGSTASTTGNITGGNILTSGTISATGNIRTAGYFFATQDINVGGDITANSYTGTSISLAGNVTGGNLKTAGLISATGNITGAYFSGNGSALTGLLTNTIQNGNSNVLVGSSAGNISINVRGVSPVSIITPLGQTVYGDFSATGTVEAGNIQTGGSISATGAVTAQYYQTSGGVTATGNVVAGNVSTTSNAAITGNLSAGNITTSGSISATGNITGNIISAASLNVTTGNITVGNIINYNANATGNIGSATTYFNTVFAKATSAQYADLAENYLSDAEYTAGTVVIFGGTNEITISTDVADERVAGAISTNPAHLMNAAMPGLPVALRGRVPVNVVGPVTKGDSLVTGATAGYAQSVGRSRLYGQAVFAKALETNLEDGKKVILAVII